MAYNKYPHYLVGPWNLGQRFLMHGFFTEYVHARLEEARLNVTRCDNDGLSDESSARAAGKPDERATFAADYEFIRSCLFNNRS